MNAQKAPATAPLAEVVAGMRSAQAITAAAQAAQHGAPEALAALAIDPLIDMKQIEAIVGLSRSRIYARLALKQFPEPIRLSRKATRWRLSAIQAWLDSLSSEPPATAGSLR